jgi:L-alanine-DL-glutamate epimerase-like enolase superfamily enzyme
MADAKDPAAGHSAGHLRRFHRDAARGLGFRHGRGQIETDEGIVGVGWCEDGCDAVSRVVENHLSRLLIGQDPFEVEGIYDRLYRGTLPYGRKGMVIQAISAIDIALWDIVGKATGKAIFELLGGPVRESVKVYASIAPRGQKSETRPRTTSSWASRG